VPPVWDTPTAPTTNITPSPSMMTSLLSSPPYTRYHVTLTPVTPTTAPPTPPSPLQP
jgi:hypothetical protein